MKATERHKLIDRIKTIEGLTDDERASLLALLREHKTYGLVWEDKPEAIEEKLRTELPILEEIKDRAIISANTDAPNHILIEGDNLEALTSLSYTHEGKIDVIYIDPPYNTGNKDFIYNDSFVDSEDSYRHSKWLSFMSIRLKIARKLLSENGVIFISIDDNEQANLRLLCDEIFGFKSFAGNISWQRTYSPRNDIKGISREIEHIIVYSKNPDWIPRTLPRNEKMDSKYSSPDGDPREWTSSDAFAPSAATHQGMVYAIQHPITGKLIYPYKGACWPLQQDKMFEEISKWGKYEYRDLQDDKERADVCGISSEEVRKGVLGIVLEDTIEVASKHAMEIYAKGNWPKFYFTNKGKGGIRRKTYKDKVNGRIATNLWLYEQVGHTDEAKKEIGKIFGGSKPFDTPKPSRLIKQIVLIASKEDSIILDFFAGSGTTLHAVMQLNAEDGGKRQCILCTNNENQICEKVTYERNKRVIQGYTKPNGEYVEGLHDNNLRYYKTAFVNRAKTPRNMQKLVNLSTDMLCIKEDVYAEKDEMGGVKTHPQVFRYFDDGKKQMLIIYREEYIAEIVVILEKMDVKKQIRTYVFSPSEDPASDLFQSVEDKVELTAIPAAIYNAYKRVLPKPKDEKVGTHGSCVRDGGIVNEYEIEEDLGGLFAAEGGEE